MVLLDEMVRDKDQELWLFPVGINSKRSFIGMARVEGLPSVALPRAIAEAYVYWKSNMQENKV